MTKHTPNTLAFSPLGRKKVLANFEGGAITSDAGLLLLREVDKKLGLTQQLGQAIQDDRHPGYLSHTMENLLKQRVYAIAAGYEDVNDHDTLKEDLCFQTAVGREVTLASRSTLSRFENSITRQSLVAMSKVLVESFIQSHQTPPTSLTLDFDPSDHHIHGHQEKRHYHGYYQSHCFLPLYVFCGDRLLVSLLRPSSIDAVKYSAAILKLLVTRLRQAWPDVKILFRGDCAFARPTLFHYCETRQVDYVIGFPKNNRIKKQLHHQLEDIKAQYEKTNEPQQVFGACDYQALRWSKKRRLIFKLDQTSKGLNLRCVITNRKDTLPERVYKKQYCPRGAMENNIKQLKLDLGADRNSCHAFLANQFRFLLSSVAYVLLNELREHSLKNTPLAHHYCGTLRLKLIKIGAVILKNTRCIRLLLSDYYPYKDSFKIAVESFVPI